MSIRFTDFIKAVLDLLGGINFGSGHRTAKTNTTSNRMMIAEKALRILGILLFIFDNVVGNDCL
jgi:hypothetical protein